MIKFFLFIILLAAIHAKVENSAEGKGGWGLNFPCWAVNNLLTRFFIGKELTAYHFYMGVMFLLLFHSPYLFIDFSFKKEFLIMGLWFWYWIVEDFMWFMESKYYGIKNFKKGRIFWHKRWLLNLPISYWISGIIGTLLLFLGR